MVQAKKEQILFYGICIWCYKASKQTNKQLIKTNNKMVVISGYRVRDLGDPGHRT